MSDPFAEAAERLASAEFAIAVTGAGASVESGIPDFRSPGGLWERYPPEEFANIDGYLANPNKVWKLWYELARMFGDCTPNPGHHALAELERVGRLRGVVTQNIDGLHQAAGSVNVVEYHGNATALQCLSCGREGPLRLDELGDTAPVCTCGGLMKPAIVFFGEMIPEAAQATAAAWVMRCDALVVVGTSATVYPAAGLPRVAKSHGAHIIECNLAPTEFTGTVTDVFLRGPAGETLPELSRLVRGLEKGGATGP